VKTDFSGDLVRLNANLSLVGAPVLEVFGVSKIYKDWMAGAKAKYDLQANELKATSLAFLHQTSDYALHTYTNDGNEFGGRFFILNFMRIFWLSPYTQAVATGSGSHQIQDKIGAVNGINVKFWIKI